MVNGPRNCDGLTLPAGHFLYRLPDIRNVDMELSQKLFCFPVHGSVIKKNPETQKLAPKKEIAGAVLAVVKGQILIDGRNTLIHGFLHGERVKNTVFNLNDTLVRLQASGEELNQRAFSGTIVADNGRNFSTVGVKFHVVKSCDGAELLYNALHLNHWFIQGKNPNL